VVVVEATGGFERPLAAALAIAAIPVAVVNPRQARDFARATGTLSKTERIDAEVLARFGEAIRAQPTAIPDQKAQQFGAILARRRQIVEMLTAEKNRLGVTLSKSLKKRIEAHIRWLEKELSRTDDDLDQTIRASAIWRENEELLGSSVPGVE
jgi:transposase